VLEIEVNFRDPRSHSRSCREGWGGPEGFGAWMIGQTSRLVLPRPPRLDADFVLQAVIGPMLANGRIPHQRMRIVINGHTIYDEAMTGLANITCPVPTAAIAARPFIEIIFEHPDAVSTSSLGEGDDVRPLAGSIWNLTLLSQSPLPDNLPAAVAQPTFHTRAIGNLANRMIQHMVALAVQDQAPDCLLTGTELPEWNIPSIPDDGTWADVAIVDEQFIDIAKTADILNSHTVYKITHRGYGQRMENFLPRERYRNVFVSEETDITGYDHRHLVINVRTGDIVDGSISIYVLTPLNFYRDLIARTGLIPVFMGQLEPNAYTDALRAAFPDAIYVPSQGAIRDFECIRRSKNIAISVSTFSWLAAWLSDADQIFMQVNGLLNPLQVSQVNLIPLGDPRYRLYLFPINTASPDFQSAHRAIDGQWREVSSPDLAAALGLPVPDPASAAPTPPEPARHAAIGDTIRMFEDIRPVLADAEAAASRGYAMDVLHHLRRLSLFDYADLMWSLPHADLPAISQLLPRMADEAAQLGWNGKSGMDLRNHTVDFCRILSARFLQITGRPMDNTRILDFGCGWGRVLRLLYWYTDPQNCCGVDAMHQAVQRCKDDNVLGRIVQSEYIATDLDVGDRRYDLIVAFSVFTHTPLRVAQVALANLRRKIRNNGLLAITVRPVEFWAQSGSEDYAEAHRTTGFSFKPIGVTAPDGEDIYGETSMTPQWLSASFPDWEIECTDRGLDPLQLIVFLTPR
jgi:SAM-dependent methyltransferase